MFRLLAISVVSLLAFSPPSSAITRDDFQVRSTEDLLELCSVASTDVLSDAAINFCHGYVEGAFQHNQALTSGPEWKPIVCLPESRPSRNDTVGGFVKWGRDHPQFKNDNAA